MFTLFLECTADKFHTALGSHYHTGLKLSKDDLGLKMFIWNLSQHDGSFNQQKTTLYYGNRTYKYQTGKQWIKWNVDCREPVRAAAAVMCCKTLSI